APPGTPAPPAASGPSGPGTPPGMPLPPPPATPRPPSEGAADARSAAGLPAARGSAARVGGAAPPPSRHLTRLFGFRGECALLLQVPHRRVRSIQGPQVRPVLRAETHLLPRGFLRDDPGLVQFHHRVRFSRIRRGRRVPPHRLQPAG